MLKIKIPNQFSKNEIRYILDILLNDFLGIEFDIESFDSDIIEISQIDSNNGSSKLTLDASFFHKIKKNWLNIKSMPDLPLSVWTPSKDNILATLISPEIPILFGSPGLIRKKNHIHLNVDIFGSAFFMLSRYEEAIIKDRDKHNRFPATSSIAFKEGFLNRPIVNEYLEILYKCLKSLWPNLKRKKYDFKKIISCDVDHPFDIVGYSLKKTILRIGARLFRDKNPKIAICDFLNFIFKKFNSDYFDQYQNNLIWIMNVNDKSNNKVLFNFIPINTDLDKEELNDMRSEKILKILKNINDRGHEIGFHPGYNTYNNYEKFKKSANVFKEALKKIAVDLKYLGGRQHYLRFDVLQTPILWEKNQFKYDSTLGYADYAGFRCGTCYEYYMYDLLSRIKMNVKQRPLIIMESSIISKSYESLGYSTKAVKRFEYFKNVCKKFNGNFTLYGTILSFAI